MKVQRKVSKSTIVEIDADKQKDAFKAVASAQEVFGEENCGLCGSDNIVPTWRTVTTVKGKKTETYEYPEYKCKKCGGRLALGTINDDTGTLYPIRRLVDGKRPANKAEKDAGTQGDYGQHQGWHKFVKEAE